jgi:hypothetical protein
MYPTTRVHTRRARVQRAGSYINRCGNCGMERFYCGCWPERASGEIEGP